MTTATGGIGTFNLVFAQGDTGTYTFTFPQDVTGYTFEFTVYRITSPNGRTVLFTLMGVIVDAPGGIVTFTFTNAETKNIVNAPCDLRTPEIDYTWTRGTFQTIATSDQF